jgi:hypothetical protein
VTSEQIADWLPLYRSRAILNAEILRCRSRISWQTSTSAPFGRFAPIATTRIAQSSFSAFSVTSELCVYLFESFVVSVPATVYSDEAVRAAKLRIGGRKMKRYAFGAAESLLEPHGDAHLVAPDAAHIAVAPAQLS